MYTTSRHINIEKIIERVTVVFDDLKRKEEKEGLEVLTAASREFFKRKLPMDDVTARSRAWAAAELEEVAKSLRPKWWKEVEVRTCTGEFYGFEYEYVGPEYSIYMDDIRF